MEKKVKKKQRMMINQKQAHQKLEVCLQIRIRNYNLEEVDRALNQEEIKIFKDLVKQEVNLQIKKKTYNLAKKIENVLGLRIN